MEDSGNIFKEGLKKYPIDTKIVKFVDTSFNMSEEGTNSWCDSITDILLSNAKLCLRRKPNRPQNYSSSKVDKMGFDRECRYLKNKVLNLAKLTRKFPNDPIIRGSFIKTKKLFKSTVRQKNKIEKNKLLSLISESQEKDPKMFWKLVNKWRGMIQFR